MNKGDNRSIRIFLSIISIFIILFLTLVVTSRYSKANQIDKTDPTIYSIGDNDTSKFTYLSDIPYIKEQSNVGWGSITLNGNLDSKTNKGLISLIVDGQERLFLKGVSAHATSNLVYDLSSYNYDYFSTFYGVDAGRKNTSDGVKFYIYTSIDGIKWDLETSSNPPIKKGNTESEYIKINIKDKKYLKLQCVQHGSATADHGTYAHAKLFKEGYDDTAVQKPLDFIKTVEEYDKELKKYYGEEIKDSYELALLQRELVKNAGYDLLQGFAALNKENFETISWLMKNHDVLKLYILGGKPDGGSYYNSLIELSRLYNKYKDDFKDTTPTNNKWYPNLTKGEVYRKMAISLSLTHSTAVGYWAQINHPSNRSDSLNRYAIFKDLYDRGKFVVSSRQDHTPWFEALQIEEMRYIMNSIVDDEEILWFNEYTQKRIDANPNQEEKYLQPHTYIAYVWPNFQNPIFHDPAKKDYWDEKFEGIFSKYGVTYSSEGDMVYKAWMSMRNEYGTGAVCGGISKLGTHIRAAHGTPASVISQPGHAAIIYYRKNADGKGYWTIDNDVSGWAQSGKTERLGIRMPLGWGNDSYVSGWAATYIILAQEAINDWDSYEKSEKLIMLADVYKNDKTKKEEILRESLTEQNINIDAWWELIKLYNEDSSKKEKDYYNLAVEMSDALLPFPLPLYNLLNLIKPKFTSAEYNFKFTLLQTKVLNYEKNYTATDRVLQPSITRTVGSYLLGQTDTSLATFSFDGEKDGKIVLSNRFDGNGIRWDYSLDGKKTWKEVSFSADEKHELQLTKDEINKITEDNDIYVHIIGANYEEENLYKIDIKKSSIPEKKLYANDLENRVMGIDLTYEWRNEKTDSWTSYKDASPNNTGNKTLYVRIGATGINLPSDEIEFKFTEDNQLNTRKYIPISNLSIHKYSTQSVDTKRPFYAPNAIDGNLYTLWHTDFRYNVLQSDTKPFITIKLSEPKYVSALEFIQIKYPGKPGDPDAIKNVRVYVSADENEWTEAGKIENCKTYGELYNITFDKSVYGQYIKIEMDTYNMFASLAMVNLYEDTTKIENLKPTANVAYDITSSTNKDVTARLVNLGEKIKITNNDGKDTYTFKENGEFIFEFVDEETGFTGSTTAKVNWIDKKAPTANISYDITSATNKNVTATLDNISEDIYILDENGTKIYFVKTSNKKVIYINYLDNVGNTTKVLYLDSEGYTEKIECYYKDFIYTVEFDQKGNITKENFKDDNGNEVNPDNKDEIRKSNSVRTKPLVHEFEENGEFTFKIQDMAGNNSTIKAKVSWIDRESPTAAVEYSTTNPTNKNVIVTLTHYSEKIAIINNEGKNTYTFTENGEFTFEFKDAAGNISTITARVDNIDKTSPKASIKYSTKQDTDGNVKVTLINPSKEITITNNNGSDTYIFTENGEFTFEFVDKLGNAGRATAKVTWIKKDDDKKTSPDKENNNQSNNSSNNNNNSLNNNQNNNTSISDTNSSTENNSTSNIENKNEENNKSENNNWNISDKDKQDNKNIVEENKKTKKNKIWIILIIILIILTIIISDSYVIKKEI